MTDNVFNPKDSKLPLPTRPPLTVDGITRWMELFKEHEIADGRRGRYPSRNDKNVWDKDSMGQWHPVEGENWHAIDWALTKGFRSLPRGLSLAKIKKKLGWDNPLTKKQIIRWMELFKEHEIAIGNRGRYPNMDDKTVWDKDKQGQWYVVEGENWHAIDWALTRGSRGLPRGSSLAKIKKKLGWNALTRKQIVRWIKLFREHEKAVGNPERYPTLGDKNVWDKDGQGQWFQVAGENWHAINWALTKGHRTLPGGSSLLMLREEEGLVISRPQKIRGFSNGGPDQQPR